MLQYIIFLFGSNHSVPYPSPDFPLHPCNRQNIASPVNMLSFCLPFLEILSPLFRNNLFLKLSCALENTCLLLLPMDSVLWQPRGVFWLYQQITAMALPMLETDGMLWTDAANMSDCVLTLSFSDCRQFFIYVSFVTNPFFSYHTTVRDTYFSNQNCKLRPCLSSGDQSQNKAG